MNGVGLSLGIQVGVSACACMPVCVCGLSRGERVHCGNRWEWTAG